MNKKELEGKVIEIQTQLAALGDLNSLVQKGTELPSLVSQVQASNATVQELIPKITAQQQSLQEVTSQVTALKDELSKRSDEVTDLVTQARSIQEKVESLKQETLAQLGRASNEKLSSSFEKVKVDLEKEKTGWFAWLAGAVGVLVAVTSGIAIWQVKEFGTLYHLGFLVKITLTSPLVYFIVFANREYNRVRSLIEEYTFKAAIARSFEAYKEIIENIFAEQQPQVFQQKLNFILEAINNLYSSPMKNVKMNALKEKELSPDIVSQLKEKMFPVGDK